MTTGRCGCGTCGSGEARPLTGHDGSVLGALVLPDGRVLSWSDDGTLRVWDLATGEGRPLTGHERWVNGALLLPDGRVLSWSVDGTLRVWDLATGEGRALDRPRWCRVMARCVLPDGRVLSWSADRTLRVWDLATGEGRALDGPRGLGEGALLLPRRARAVVERGRHAAGVGPGDGRGARARRATRTGCAARWLLPDGRVLSWSVDGTLRVWDLATGEGRALTGHERLVTGALLLPDGRVLSWSADGTLRVWDLATRARAAR